jgi:succinate dehydrogenase / fumarate reductase cytochrome b subunit
MPVRARPLSPHLQVYRWQISNSLSILHRVTGAALALGLVALSYWFGVLVLVGWTFSFLFHLLNGVRHLFWDAGYGFERIPRRASGWVAVAGAGVLTACVWLALWHGVHA